MSEVKLWKHQEDAIAKARDLDHYALFFDPGLGKSRSSIDIIRNKFNDHKKFFKTLILSPLITLHNWKNEWLKFSGVTPDQIVILEGTGRQRVFALERAREKFNDQFIAITNYESLVQVRNVFEAIYEFEPEIVLLDESQRVKSIRAKRTKQAIKVCDRARFKYILSGTPILNTPMDVFTQFRCLDGGKSFGKNFYTFRATYFIDKNANMGRDNYFPNFVPRDGINELFNDIIYKVAARAVKSECLDLPPLIKQKIYVELSMEQKRLYESMEKDFIAFLGDKACTATLAITKMLRLLQILTGFIAMEDGVTMPLKSTPREAALEELLEEITPGNKVIVWCIFKENYAQVRRVCEKLGVPYLEGHGGIENKDKYDNLQVFATDPLYRVFIANPKALGVGVNIIEASYSIYFSRSHSLEDDIQSAARNYRGGSEIHSKITRIDLIAQGTLDEKIFECLENKLNVAEEILKWKKS